MPGQQQQPLTELATRYQHPTGPAHWIVANTGKSGLTPVYVPPQLKHSLSVNHKKYIEALEAYQRGRCFFFTPQELVDLEAFAPYYNSWSIEGREDGGIDLERLNAIPIHPLYAKSKWDSLNFNHIGKIPLGRGRPGYFEAQNPLVWDALEPCIRLASGILSNSSNLVWWDALFNGEYEFIEDDIPDRFKGGQLLRFKPSIGPPPNEQQLQRDILGLSNKISLHIVSGITELATGRSIPGDGFDFGITLRDKAREIRMAIAFELLEALINGGLAPGEVKLEIFRVAVTLLHETAHAIWYNIATQHGAVTDYEPYFEGQPISELGYSMETIVFGGRPFAMTDVRDPPLDFGQGTPCGAIFNVPYYCNRALNYSKGDGPLVPPLPSSWDYMDSFPIPIGYFEDLCRPEFLDHARQYGIEATRMGPKTIGSRVAVKAIDRIGPHTWAPDVDTPLPANIIINNMMTMEEQSAASLENLRRIRAQRVLDAIGGRQDRIDPGYIDVDPMDVDDSDPQLSGIDLNHYMVQGKNFDSSSISTESDHWELPECPRYDEICYYLISNRSQGRLCLDTMEFDIPAFTVFHYIQDFGGINITPEEWIAFLQNCDDRQEMFYYHSLGRGSVVWMNSHPEIQPPAPPPLVPLLPVPPALQWFRDVCLKDDFLESGLPDIDFVYLLKTLKRHDPRGGGWLNEIVLKELIDWQENHGDLWRWGPNWIVRRRIHTWPSQRPSSSPSSSGGSPSSTS